MTADLTGLTTKAVESCVGNFSVKKLFKVQFHRHFLCQPGWPKSHWLPQPFFSVATQSLLPQQQHSVALAVVSDARGDQKKQQKEEKLLVSLSQLLIYHATAETVLPFQVRAQCVVGGAEQR